MHSIKKDVVYFLAHPVYVGLFRIEYRLLTKFHDLKNVRIFTILNMQVTINSRYR